MKTYLSTLIMFFLCFSIGFGQEVEKKKETKAVIKTKTVKNGKVSEESKRASGEDAKEILKMLREELEADSVEWEIEIDDQGRKVRKMVSRQKTSMGSSSSKTSGEEVAINASMVNGVTSYVIKVKDEDGKEKTLKWNGEGEMPKEISKYLNNSGVMIESELGGSSSEIRAWIEDKIYSTDVLDVYLGISLAGKDGLEVMEIENDSPAARAGIKVGDRITEIDGYHLPDFESFIEKLRSKKANDIVKIRYARNGMAQTSEITLITRE